ncbi:MAG: c-type cytochrome [Bacteroidota bacterium]|nr:c-type cytochrome [Bacteroidota bacterium]
MKANILFIALLLFFSSCSKHDGSDKQAAKNDSTNVADSSSTPTSIEVIKTLTYEQREGKFFYTKYCLVCHGSEGKGDGFNAFNLNPRPKDFTEKQYMQALTDEKLIETVSQGGRGVNKSPSMPSWGGRLSKDEILYVVAYVRTFAADTTNHK